MEYRWPARGPVGQCGWLLALCLLGGASACPLGAWQQVPGRLTSCMTAQRSFNGFSLNAPCHWYGISIDVGSPLVDEGIATGDLFSARGVGRNLSAAGYPLWLRDIEKLARRTMIAIGVCSGL